MDVKITRWAAWAPGLTGREDWLAWFESPRIPEGEEKPALPFIPAMVRRRYSLLSRMVLQAAYDCCPPEQLANVNVVTATRFGELSTCLELLKVISRDEPVSPIGFSHSVHNAPAGHFSISAVNTAPSSTVSGMDDTFSYGFLEGLSVLHRQPGYPVLLLVGEDRIPEDYLAVITAKPFPHAVALLLEPADETTEESFERVAFDWGQHSVGQQAHLAMAGTGFEIPPVIHFLHWLNSKEPEIVLRSTRQSCRWSRRVA